MTIEEYRKKIALANKTKGRELRLSIEEANLLLTEIMAIVTKEKDYLLMITDLQNRVNKNITLSGGQF
jgi:hypothetical protein